MPIENTNPSLARNPEYGRTIGLDPALIAPPTANDGLMRHPETGHLVGIEQVPVVEHPMVGAEYPRWITPHKSHVVVTTNAGARKKESGDFETESDIAGRSEGEEHPGANDLKTENDNLIVPRDAVVSVPGFQHHVRRSDGAISVLVNNKQEEERAMGEFKPFELPTYIPVAERLAAERVYDMEATVVDQEEREKRIAEIIKERRQAALEEAEKALEAQREQVNAINVDDVRAADSVGAFQTFTYGGNPIGGVPAFAEGERQQVDADLEQSANRSDVDRASVANKNFLNAPQQQGVNQANPSYGRPFDPKQPTGTPNIGRTK